MSDIVKFRQGDVLVTRIEEFPAGLEPVDRDRGRIVLAYGEVTGHAHAIADRAAELFSAADMSEMEGRFLLVEAEEGVVLAHEEHSTLVIPPGMYRVQRQREYAPEQPVYVAD